MLKSKANGVGSAREVVEVEVEVVAAAVAAAALESWRDVESYHGRDRIRTRPAFGP